MTLSFDGRVAIVTGSGNGLGRAYAELLGNLGAAVVVNDPGVGIDGTGGDHGPADEVVLGIKDRGGTAIASYDSVATREGGENIVQTAIDAFGTVDVVINNAGINREGEVNSITDDDLAATFGVHVLGAFHVSQPAFRIMKERQYGRFVFISSSAGMFGLRAHACYGAAKTAMVGLMNVIAIEGGPFGISANAVMPAAPTRMASALSPETYEQLSGSIDYGATLTPENVAVLAVALASEQCPVTKQIYSAVLGRFARVFVGVTDGWHPDNMNETTPSDVVDHFEEIDDTSHYTIPESVFDEMEAADRMNAGRRG